MVLCHVQEDIPKITPTTSVMSRMRSFQRCQDRARTTRSNVVKTSTGVGIVCWDIKLAKPVLEITLQFTTQISLTKIFCASQTMRLKQVKLHMKLEKVEAITTVIPIIVSSTILSFKILTFLRSKL